MIRAWRILILRDGTGSVSPHPYSLSRRGAPAFRANRLGGRLHVFLTDLGNEPKKSGLKSQLDHWYFPFGSGMRSQDYVVALFRVFATAIVTAAPAATRANNRIIVGPSYSSSWHLPDRCDQGLAGSHPQRRDRSQDCRLRVGILADVSPADPPTSASGQ